MTIRGAELLGDIYFLNYNIRENKIFLRKKVLSALDSERITNERGSYIRHKSKMENVILE